MNIEKMKEFINIRQALRDSGVVGVSVLHDEIHVEPYVLKEQADLKIKKRGFGNYPYEISAVVDGVKMIAILRPGEVNQFPQFKEQTKAELEKQLAALEQEEEATA